MKVVLTHHALDRYIDRVKPWLERDEAKAEIERLIDGREPIANLPWAYGVDVDCYLELADGIALALKWTDGYLAAVTCLIRTGASEEVVAERRRRKRIRKRRSRAQKARERLARGQKPERTEVGGWSD